MLEMALALAVLQNLVLTCTSAHSVLSAKR
jgi:hypothetical protein